MNKEDKQRIVQSFIKFIKLNLKTLKLAKYKINKQMILECCNNNFNDSIGLMLLSIFFKINIYIAEHDEYYVISEDDKVDIYRPFIVLYYDKKYIPTFGIGENTITLDYLFFSKINSIKIITPKFKKISWNKKERQENIFLSSDDDILDEETRNILNQSEKSLMRKTKNVLLQTLDKLKLLEVGFEYKNKKFLVEKILDKAMRYSK